MLTVFVSLARRKDGGDVSGSQWVTPSFGATPCLSAAAAAATTTIIIEQ
jgi:hypothetical protein